VPERYRITVEAQPSAYPPESNLKRWLKAGLRTFALKVLDYEEITPAGPPGQPPAAPPPSSHRGPPAMSQAVRDPRNASCAILDAANGIRHGEGGA
jgi:hypothetical protein